MCTINLGVGNCQPNTSPKYIAPRQLTLLSQSMNKLDEVSQTK